MLIANECVQALRSLRKRPWQSLIIFLIIAAGIGMSSAYYSASEALLLRPLPFDPHGRLFNVEQRLLPSKARIMNSHQNLNDLREQSTTLDGLAVYQAASGSIMANGQPEYVQGMKVDRYFFPLLGVAPAQGRGFMAEDEQGTPHSIILSHKFWQKHFAGDQAITGKDILLDKRPYKVIGIMPQSFYFPFIEQAEEDFWIPLCDQSTARGDYDKYGLAQLKPGATLQQAQAELALIGPHIAQTNQGHERHLFNLRAYREVIVEELRPMLLILAGIMACVLAVVCINIASLLLVEAMRYRQEVKIRFALGGKRWQIMRVFLLRAFMLALSGGVAGIGVAWILIVLIHRFIPAGFPGIDQITLDVRLLLFTAAITLGTGISFGLWPALAATQKLHQLSLHGVRQAAITNSMEQSRKYLVMLQLTSSTAFLVVTGLLGLSFFRLLNVNPGIQLDHRLLVMVRPIDPDMQTIGALQLYFSGIQEQLSSIPGVQAVAISSYAPLGAHSIRDFRIQDSPSPKDPMEWMAQDNIVSANYFGELGITIHEGRTFNEEDRKDGRLVAIVNEAFAQRFFTKESALKRNICVTSNNDCPWREIVGVVADTRDSRMDTPAEPAYFIPFSQASAESLSAAAFTVHTKKNTASVFESIQKQVAGLSPRATGIGPYTMEEMRSRQFMGPHHRVWFLVVTTILSVLLTAMGVYGVIAGAVEQRRREIAIRLALGASPENVSALFYRQMLFMLLPGLLAGLIGAAMLAQYISSILFGTTPIDPGAYCGATLILSAVAFIATALPIRNALQVSTAEALRVE